MSFRTRAWANDAGSGHRGNRKGGMSTWRPGIPTFRHSLILACIMVVGYPLLMLTLGENQAARTLIGDVVSPIAGILAAGGLMCAVRQSAPRSGRLRLGWSMLAIAVLLSTAGDIVWAVLELLLRQQPFPSVADGFYVLFYVLFAAGLILLCPLVLTPLEWLRLSLDTLIVMITAATT